MQKLFPALIVFALTWLMYRPALGFEFINFDDGDYLFANPHVLSGLSWENLRWAIGTSHGGHWHPLSWLAHMLVAANFGAAPFWHHAVNVGLHSINAVLVLFVLRSLSLNPVMSLAMAAIWASHPMRIESVVWASQLKEVLSQFFALAAILVFLRRPNKPGSRVIISVLFVLGLLAKPTVIVLPGLFVILECWRLREGLKLETLFKAVNSQLHLIVVALAFAGVFVLSQSSAGGLRDLEEVSVFERMQLFGVSVMAYIAKFFWPGELSFFYPRSALGSALGVGVLLGLLSLVSLAWQLRSRMPELLFVFVWVVAATLPMSGLLTIGGQLYADRWTYLAHVGVCFGLGRVLERARGKGLVVVAMGAVLCAAVFMRELSYWRSSVTLMTRAIEVDPHNFMAHTNLASAFLDSGDIAAALRPAEEAVRLNPTYPEALNNLGVVRAQQGRLSEAREVFMRALRIRPGYAVAQRNLGFVEEDLRQVK